MSQGLQALPEAGKGKEVGSPPGTPRRKQLRQLWPHVTDLGASGLQGCKRKNLCCFKPQSLWSFVTAASGN